MLATRPHAPVLLATVWLAVTCASCTWRAPLGGGQARKEAAESAAANLLARGACASPEGCAASSAVAEVPSAGPSADPPAKPSAATQAVAAPDATVPGQAEPGAPRSAPLPTEGPLELSVQAAVLAALENNQELVVQRIAPAVAQSAVDEELAIFDPLLRGTIGKERVVGRRLRGVGIRENFTTDSIVGEAAIEKLFPTGTGVAVEAETEVDDQSSTNQLVRSRVGLTVTQALLRGFGPEVNLAAVRQARLDTLASEYELRGFTEALVAQVEQTYWDYVLAGRRIEILTRSVAMAEQQLKDSEERARAGTVPAIDVVACQAEAAMRRQDLVDARSDREKARILLLRLMNPRGPNVWNREVRTSEQPAAPTGPIDDVETRVQLAERMRPELNQARLMVQRGDLEIVRTRNGLLPRMDLFVTLGKSGYGESFGTSWKDIGQDRYDVLLGVSAEYPAGNRLARAQHQRAVLGRRQAEEAVRNLAQLVQADVRTACVEVERARQQIEATSTTRKLDEAKLNAEMEKFRLGKASSFQVVRAQRDLTKSLLDEAQAIADYQKAVVELYRLEGSLLKRRGIVAPGDKPVELSQSGQ